MAGRDRRDLGGRQQRASQVKYNFQDTQLISSRTRAKKPRPLHFPSNRLLAPWESSQSSFRGNVQKVSSIIQQRAKARMGLLLGMSETETIWGLIWILVLSKLLSEMAGSKILAKGDCQVSAQPILYVDVYLLELPSKFQHNWVFYYLSSFP